MADRKHNEANDRIDRSKGTEGLEKLRRDIAEVKIEPQKKRRGRRRKTELTGEEGDLPLIGVDGEAEADDDTEE